MHFLYSFSKSLTNIIMNRWVGRVAVVSGASSGIGAEIAKQLAIEGLKVVGMARRKERIEELAKKLPTNCKGKLVAVKCSVNDEKEVKEAFDWVDKNLGGISIMINNAGLSKGVSFEGNVGTPSDWKDILDTNVLGLSMCSRLALGSMLKHKIDDGQFININSVCGHSMTPSVMLPSSMYYASKHAVTVLTDALRLEVTNLKTKIRVSSISPGIVRTEFLDTKGTDDQMKSIAKQAPGLLPEHITSSVVYILSAPACVNITELTIKPVGEPF